MTETDPDRLAFPCLTVREHFAALAMQGILGNVSLTEQLGRTIQDEGKLQAGAAALAVVHADALIAALNQDNPWELVFPDSGRAPNA